MYLQKWSPALNANSSLPPDLKRMICTGRTYNVSFSALNIPNHVKNKLPTWYHIGADKNPHARASKCLKTCHEIQTTGDLIILSHRLHTPNPQDFHQDIPNCTCAPSTQDHTLGCPDPNKCCHKAREILTRLKPKWNPLSDNSNQDNLSLAPRRKKANEDAHNQNSPQTFNPSIKTEGDLETYFRVFTNPLASCHDPALRPMQIGNIPRQTSRVYIDGRSKIIDEELRAGSGIWYGHHNQRNTHLCT